MRSRLLVAIVLAIALTATACSSDADNTTTTKGDTDQLTATAEATTTTTEALTTTLPDEPAAEEPGSGANSGSAMLTIGDETWNFDRVELCGKPASPDTSSFVLIAKLEDWQLIAEVVDQSGAQRLEGDGVYDTISFQNNGDPTLSWLANLEAAEMKFIVIDGSSVTASTTFDAVTGLSDDTPSTLEATCP